MMRIAQVLSDVDTEGVAPLHNMAEFIEHTPLSKDLPSTSQASVLQTGGDGYISFPSIPASATSR